jgi:hypothetical protein
MAYIAKGIILASANPKSARAKKPAEFGKFLLARAMPFFRYLRKIKQAEISVVKPIFL